MKIYKELYKTARSEEPLNKGFRRDMKIFMNFKNLIPTMKPIE